MAKDLVVWVLHRERAIHIAFLEQVPGPILDLKN